MVSEYRTSTAEGHPVPDTVMELRTSGVRCVCRPPYPENQVTLGRMSSTNGIAALVSGR